MEKKNVWKGNRVKKKKGIVNKLLLYFASSSSSDQTLGREISATTHARAPHAPKQTLD